MNLKQVALVGALVTGGGFLAATAHTATAAPADTTVASTAPDTCLCKADQLRRQALVSPDQLSPREVVTSPAPMQYFQREVGNFVHNGGQAAAQVALMTAKAGASSLVSDGLVDAQDAPYVVGVGLAQILSPAGGELGLSAQTVLGQARFIESHPGLGTPFSVTPQQENNALATVTLNPNHVPLPGMTKSGAVARFQATLNYYEQSGHGSAALTEYLTKLEDNPSVQQPSTRLGTLVATLSRPAFRNQVILHQDRTAAELYLAAERASVSMALPE